MSATSAAYDSWLPDSGRLYQVQTTIQSARPAARPCPDEPLSSLYEKLPGGFPQIEAVTSLAPGKTVTEHDGQPMFIDSTTVDRQLLQGLALPSRRARRRLRCPTPIRSC
jgi:putative ABC transport system permease protein